MAAAVGLEPGRTTTVGSTTVRAPRFPASAVLAEPDHAKAALALTGDVRSLAMFVRTKPGKAKARAAELAASLGDSAPRIVPYLLEEVARLFAEHGNRPWAGQIIRQAHQARQDHDLPLDPVHDEAVMTELIRAGAMTDRAMSDYAQELARRLEPQAALGLFTRLATERVNGGRLPYPRLPKDLEPLTATATDSPQAAREVSQTILAELVGRAVFTCRLADASGAFWKAYRTALADAGRRDPAVRRALARRHIHTYRWQSPPAPADEWVQMLLDAGTIDLMRSGEISARDWVAFYLTRGHANTNKYPRLLADVIRTLPGLDGLRLRLYNCHAEVADALLARGVDLELTGEWFGLTGRSVGRIKEWARQKERRPLDALVASSLWPRILQDVDRDPFLVRRLEEHESARTLLRRQVVRELGPDLGEHPTLAELEARCSSLERGMSSATAQTLRPHIEELISRTDGPALLATALRAGLRAELTWPALEAAAERLRATHGPGPRISLHESWPAVGVACNGEVIWVDGPQEVAHATFTPASFEPMGDGDLEWAHYLRVGEQTLAEANHGNSTARVWSDAQGRAVNAGLYNSTLSAMHMRDRPSNLVSMPLPGGRLCHIGLVRRDDPRILVRHQTNYDRFFCEGSTYWCVPRRPAGVRQIDPTTGAMGEEGLPPSLAELTADARAAGYTLRAEVCTWMPTTVSTGYSLMSTSAGRHTWVVLTHPGADDGTDALLLDAYGRSWHVSAADGGEVAAFSYGMVPRPGGGSWLVTAEGLRPVSQEGDRLSAEPAVARSRNAAGDLHVLEALPLVGFHHLVPRCPQVSERLRSVSAEDVAGILGAAAGERGEGEERDLDEAEAAAGARAASREAVTEALGEVPDALADSIVGVALRVNRLLARGAALAKAAG